MSVVHIDHAHSVTPRLEMLLAAHMRLRHTHTDRRMEFELGLAIEALAAGEPTSHTECIERWSRTYMGWSS